MSKAATQTTEKDYYKRKYVREMLQIFDYPRAPKLVTQQPFDGSITVYETIIKKQWHEIGREDWWHYLNDLCYVELQQDFFDFVFPAFLIIWREGLERRTYQPASENELFGAIHRGRILERMMEPSRRAAVELWIVDAFCSQVETMVAEDIDSSNYRNDALHFFLWTFNAIGQSVPIVRNIIERIGSATTPGRARFWLVIAAGLCFSQNTVPGIKPWSPNEGGGGIYLLETEAIIFDYGFLPKNLDDFSRYLTITRVQALLSEARAVDLTDQEHSLIEACLHRIAKQEEAVCIKLIWYLENLAMPDLGGVQREPDFFEAG